MLSAAVIMASLLQWKVENTAGKQANEKLPRILWSARRCRAVITYHVTASKRLVLQSRAQCVYIDGWQSRQVTKFLPLCKPNFKSLALSPRVDALFRTELYLQQPYLDG